MTEILLTGPLKLNSIIPILINWTSPFPICGLFGANFLLHSIFKRIVCKLPVQTLIRHKIVRVLTDLGLRCLHRYRKKERLTYKH